MADKDKKEDKNNTSQNLGCLEEDDEFEEFPVEGTNNYQNCLFIVTTKCFGIH